MSMSAFGAGKGCGARSAAAAAGVRSTASASSASSACSVDGRARRDGAVIGRSSDCAVCAFFFFVSLGGGGMSGIDFAALRREREARHGAPAPVERDRERSTQGAAPSSPSTAPPSSKRRRRGENLATLDAAPLTGPTIFVGGALKDSRGRHSLRPPQVPSKAYEVDCRRSGTEIKQVGNVASLTSGLGSLNDKKPKSQAESLHVLAWLERDAREVDRALRRGEHVWCHCAQGFNRGPSGVLAYLLSYTDATWQQACRRVSDARSRARTTRNTFHVELLMLSKKVRGRLRTV